MSDDTGSTAPTPNELSYGAALPPDPHAARLDDVVPVYMYDPRPALVGPPSAGVTPGYVVTWSGEPGPGTSTPVAMLVGDDGWVTIVPTGETQDVTITDDRDDGMSDLPTNPPDPTPANDGQVGQIKVRPSAGGCYYIEDQPRPDGLHHGVSKYTDCEAHLRWDADAEDWIVVWEGEMNPLDWL